MHLWSDVHTDIPTDMDHVPHVCIRLAHTLPVIFLHMKIRKPNELNASNLSLFWLFLLEKAGRALLRDFKKTFRFNTPEELQTVATSVLGKGPYSFTVGFAFNSSQNSKYLSPWEFLGYYQTTWSPCCSYQLSIHDSICFYLTFINRHHSSSH